MIASSFQGELFCNRFAFRSTALKFYTMARSSQQARRDLINVQRLLTSLEAAAFSIKPDRPLLTEEELPGADYFGTLSTITVKKKRVHIGIAGC